MLLQNEKPDRKMSYRELRFHNFASVEYDGIAYMTPQDFLESVTEKAPRRKYYRRIPIFLFTFEIKFIINLNKSSFQDIVVWCCVE